MIHLLNRIRQVPDFPVPGIIFYDLLPAISESGVLNDVISQLCDACGDRAVTKVAGIDARGLIFGAPLACRLGAGFIPVRKASKLPGRTVTESYTKEYGTDLLAVQDGLITASDHVLIVDDIIATGGTARAAEKLVQRYTNSICHLFLLQLDELNGAARLTHEHKVLYHI